MGKVGLAVLSMLAIVLCAGCAAGFEVVPKVAVIADPGGGREGESARQHLARMERILQRAGLANDVVSQEQVLAGALGSYDVAIIPYAPNLSGAAKAMLKSFCSDGGKVMCFYTTNGLNTALGLQGLSYVASPDRTLFCHVRCRAGALKGLPGGFDQVSWNVSVPEPGPRTIVLADWLDMQGKDSGYAAATISPGGLFFSHVLLAEGDENEANAGTMLRAAAQYLAHGGRARPDIAIVYGTVSEAAGRPDSSGVGAMVGEMERILTSAGLPYAVLTDEAVAQGALKGRRAAILPMNFSVTDEEVSALRQFTGGGGKVIGLFSVDSRLLPMVGVADAEFRAGGSAMPFNVVQFNAAAPARFPKAFAQRTSNVIAAKPAADGRVVADWFDANGTDTGVPAVILSPTGMFFSSVLRAGDVANTSQFILAGIAHLAGEDIYAPAAHYLSENLWDFRRYQDRASLVRACEGNTRAAEAVAEATRLESAAVKKLAAGKAYDAYAGFAAARDAAELAFIRSLPSAGPREFRGAWLHSPDVPGDDWDAVFAGMRRAHLNALAVNVCSAGYAHYESDVLPLSRLIKERGPQMDKMLAAAKKNGVEVHLWRVNFNLMRPEKQVLDRFVAEKRVCLDPQGKIIGGPSSATLCPSNPANQQLEIEATLEMTRKFHPDGIQLDYIRYPGGDACFCDGCRARFEKTIGAEVKRWPEDVRAGGALEQKYLAFRRDQITAVVREVSRRSREIDPSVKISADVFNDWDSARDSVGQDWTIWVQNGFLDFVCPMDYLTDMGVLASTVSKQRKWVNGRVPLQVGLGAWKASAAWQVADMVDTARTNGADGIVFFDYRGPVASTYIPALSEGPLRMDVRTPWAK